MNAALIGIVTGLIVIVAIAPFKHLDKKLIYGLVLSGIGFLYVGYTWMDFTSISINIIQAIIFTLLSYFGIRKNMYYLAAGYFLHGLWDFVYHFIADPKLLPPHYDMFCSTIDFLIGFYLLWVQYQLYKKGLASMPQTIVAV